MNLKVLVTGAAGFIGSTLTHRLLADGHDVVGVDSMTAYYSRDLKQQNLNELTGERFTFIDGDLSTMDLKALLTDVSVVFHQAGQPGVRASWGEEFASYIKENVSVTQALLEAAKSSHSLKKFVYASSSSVYGNAERFPTTELDRPEPMSPYGVTKLAAEHLCSLYARNYDVPTVSLRYFTVYGPKQRPDMAFTRFLTSAIKGLPISIYGDGEQIRDFTYVDDIVEGNVRAGMGEAEPGTVVNLSGGSNVSVNHTLKIIEEMAQRPLNVHYTRAVDGDVVRTGGDSSLARKILNWSPAVAINDGLAKHYDWALFAVRQSNANV